MTKAKSYPDSQAAERERLTWLTDPGLQHPWTPAYAPAGNGREAFHSQAEGLGPSSLQPSRLDGSVPLASLAGPELSSSLYERVSVPLPGGHGAARAVNGAAAAMTGPPAFHSRAAPAAPAGWPAPAAPPGPAAPQGLIRPEPPPLPEQCFGMFAKGGPNLWMGQSAPLASCGSSWSTAEVTPFGQLAVE